MQNQAMVRFRNTYSHHEGCPLRLVMSNDNTYSNRQNCGGNVDDNFVKWNHCSTVEWNDKLRVQIYG